MVWVAVFWYAPIWGLKTAFQDYNILNIRQEWVQPLLANFWFLRDREFWNVVLNTVKIAGLKLLTGFPAPIILALLINEVRNVRAKKTVQTIVYLPHFISWVIYAGIIYRLLDAEALSPVNRILALIGGRPMAALGADGSFLWVLLSTNVLKEVGWGTIIYLAGITAIDRGLYDAAEIDGANRWQQARFITLPSLAPLVAILLILSIPNVINAGFDQIWNMQNASVASAANILDIYILRIGIMHGNYAYGAALGLISNLTAFTLVLIANKLSKQSIGHGLW
jgi:putative aldouronate transport system permease protein